MLLNAISAVKAPTVYLYGKYGSFRDHIVDQKVYVRKRTLHKRTLFRVQKCRIGDQFRKGIVANDGKMGATHFRQRLLQCIVEQVLGKMARNSRMRCLIPQPLCRILLIKQVKNRVQLTFTLDKTQFSLYPAALRRPYSAKSRYFSQPSDANAL